MCPQGDDREIPPLDVTGPDLETLDRAPAPKPESPRRNQIEAQELSFRANPVPEVAAAQPGRTRLTAMIAAAVVLLGIALFVFLNRQALFPGGEEGASGIEPIAGAVNLDGGGAPGLLPGSTSGPSVSSPSATPASRPSPSATSRPSTPQARVDPAPSTGGGSADDDLLAPVLPPDPMEILKDKLDSSEKKALDLDNQLQAMKRRYETEKGKADDERKGRQRAESKLQTLTQDHNELKARLAQTEKELKANIESLEKSLEATNETLAKAQESIQALSKENEGFKAEIAGLQNERRILRRKSDLQEKSLEEERSAGAQLVTRLQRYQRDLEEERTAKQSALDKNRDLESQLAATRQELTKEKERIYPGRVVPIEDPELTPPERVKYSIPKYPGEAKRAGVSGEVQLKALVSETGEVIRVEVLSYPPGGQSLAVEAEEAVRKWQYNPAFKKGVQVKTWLRIGINFQP